MIVFFTLFTPLQVQVRVLRCRIAEAVEYHLSPNLDLKLAPRRLEGAQAEVCAARNRGPMRRC